VELVMVLPWIFTIMFGLAESARLMMAYSTLSDAARAGTRYAIVHGSYRTGTGVEGPSGPGNTANVIAAVKQVTSGAGLSPGNVTVYDSGAEPMYPDGTNKIGARVKVKVSYAFTSVLPLIVPFSVTLGSTSEGMICY
jgi:Flp pilus assembly protein TadG